MRTLVKVTVCAALATALATPASSQGIFGGIAKKVSDAASQKAQDKVNGKIDEMTQKMVDNSFDSMFGSSAKPSATAPAPAASTGAGSASSSGASAGAATSPSAGAGNATGGAGASANASPFWNNNDAKTESSYTFNVVTTMEIASSKNAGDKTVFKMHYNTNEPYSGALIVPSDAKKQQGTAFVVLDAKNQVMVMLMTSDKSKASMAFGWNDAQKYAAPAGGATGSGQQQQVNWDTVKVWRNFTKIGSKTILGYSADGYHMDTADGTAEIWVSHDPKLNVGSMFGASSSLKQMHGRVPDDYPQGTMLLMTAVNNKSGETMTMTVTNVDTNANVTYNMADYPKAGTQKK